MKKYQFYLNTQLTRYIIYRTIKTFESDEKLMHLIEEWKF